MNEKINSNIAIVGGGLTGLSIAYFLKRAKLRVHIFEKADRVGGVIKTHHENGFTYETGPNTGVLSHPEAAELLDNLREDCETEIADEKAKSRWIWKNGKWEPLPSGVISGIKTPLFSFSDKLRLLGEPFRTKGNNPNETLKELVLRRMGQSFLDYAVDPFVLGIYSGDPARLVPKYALPKLYNLEQDFGSFIGGSIQKARQPKTDWEKKATREIFSVKGGLQNLIDALEKSIGKENITLNCTNLQIENNGTKQFKTNQSDEVFTHVISTVGSYQLDGVFPFISTDKTQTINQLEYAKVAQVSLGFNKWEGVPLKAFGGLIPFKEKRDLLGILFLSSFLKKKAPKEGALLSVFLGGVRRPEMAALNDEQIKNTVAREVTEMLGLKTFEPDLFKISRYDHAIPQYGKESEEKLKAISEVEKEFPGLILAGNIRDGIGMADRIRQARKVAMMLT
ncbi:MAG TPA: protoporphyrinogen oxidase [Prolixibacteraceae bacterium]|nr:protoporphyrinogen oxidase [Prolixibacteraceae bacterium]